MGPRAHRKRQATHSAPRGMFPAYPPNNMFGHQAMAAANDMFVRPVISGLTLPGDVWRGELTREEIADRVGDLGGLVTLGAGAIPAEANALRMGIRAYHGSPHDFDKFSLDKIGTGEGAQAYGHGLYFAEKEGVARSYRDALSMRQMTDGTTVDWNDPGSVAAAWLRLKGDKDAAVKHLKSIKPEHGADNYRVSQEAAAMLERGDPLPGFAPGRMYEVEIDAEPEQFLDWDKPLPADHPVRQKLADLATKAINSENAADRNAARDGMRLAANENLTGEGAYHQLNRLAEANRETLKEHVGERALFAKTSELANDVLQGHGVKGIRYLDQGSRTQGDGSRNYVVFDDKLISILRKYGMFGGMASGGAAATGMFGSSGDPNSL